MKRSQWLYEIFTYLLALLFLFTALSKVMDYHHYVRQMHNQVFPKLFTSILIVAVPLAELVAVALLFWTKTRLTGLWISLGMMAAFTIYIALIIMRVFPWVPCSCAGVFNSMTWTQHLVFNVVFTFMAAIALYLGYQQKKADVRTPAL